MDKRSETYTQNDAMHCAPRPTTPVERDGWCPHEDLYFHFRTQTWPPKDLAPRGRRAIEQVSPCTSSEDDDHRQGHCRQS